MIALAHAWKVTTTKGTNLEKRNCCTLYAYVQDVYGVEKKETENVSVRRNT